MKRNAHFSILGITLILTSLFLAPTMGEAKEDTWSEMHKMRRATLVK